MKRNKLIKYLKFLLKISNEKDKIILQKAINDLENNVQIWQVENYLMKELHI